MTVFKKTNFFPSFLVKKSVNCKCDCSEIFFYSFVRGFNNFGDKRLFEVEQTAVIEKGP